MHGVVLPVLWLYQISNPATIHDPAVGEGRKEGSEEERKKKNSFFFPAGWLGSEERGKKILRLHY